MALITTKEKQFVICSDYLMQIGLLSANGLTQMWDVSLKSVMVMRTVNLKIWLL